MAYIGIDDTARKITDIYVGVNDVARKVIKAYVGVDGIARLAWEISFNPNPDTPGNYPTLLPRNRWFDAYRGFLDDTETITILDSYTPTEGEDNGIAIDEEGTGSIKLYAVGPNLTPFRDLIIAGNGSGRIYTNTDAAFLFSGQGGGVNANVNDFTNLKTINGLTLLDTSKTTNMASMFEGDKSLTSLDLTSFDTSNVTNMNFMFATCTNMALIEVAQDKWDTTSAEALFMFSNCGVSNVTYTA